MELRPEIAQLEPRLIAGLESMDITVGEEAVEQLQQFMELLAQWNQTHNLTAIDSFDDMLSKHIFDCASIFSYLKGSSLVDVGSGAGLPGMVLAILSPARQVTSIESRGKKAQFQMYAKNQLKLENFELVQTRVEDYEPKRGYAMVVARAFASLGDFIKHTRHLIADDGRWLAMKGQLDEQELRAAKKLNVSLNTYAIKVPELDAQRHLVVGRKKK